MQLKLNYDVEALKWNILIYKSGRFYLLDYKI